MTIMNYEVDSDLIFRDADPSEDDELARVMYNAFLPIWNHNWFQGLAEPLPAIPSTTSQLTKLQSRRLAFYRSFISLVRCHSGDVTIAYPRTSSSSSSNLFTSSPSPVAAVVLLLPPHARATLAEPIIAWRSGMLPSLLGLGLRGAWRVAVTFEGNVSRMIASRFRELGIANGKQEELVHCFGCVRNPECHGPKGPARKLFDWAIRRYWDREREQANGEKIQLTSIWLDTTTDDGVRAYEAIGFKLVGECMVETGSDKNGIKLKGDADRERSGEGRKVAKQRVMVRLPG